MDDNGTGEGGGNGSVWWAITHGSPHTTLRPPTLAGGPRPTRGQVKIGSSVEGHDDTEFDRIGHPDHPGTFRVQLRFRKADLHDPTLVSPEDREWIERYAKPIQGLDKDSVFLVIHVPAIRRDAPKGDGPWPDMPWEVHWGW